VPSLFGHLPLLARNQLRISSFSTANYSLPDDLRVNNTVYIFQEDKAPVLLDSIVGNKSVDGHDYRSNFAWILESGFDWVITDTPDEWDRRLREQGKRNIEYLLADGRNTADQSLASGWYKRRHARDLSA
jgi:hypothetical protein